MRGGLASESEDLPSDACSLCGLGHNREFSWGLVSSSVTRGLAGASVGPSGGGPSSPASELFRIFHVRVIGEHKEVGTNIASFLRVGREGREESPQRWGEGEGGLGAGEGGWRKSQVDGSTHSPKFLIQSFLGSSGLGKIQEPPLQGPPIPPVSTHLCTRHTLLSSWAGSQDPLGWEAAPAWGLQVNNSFSLWARILGEVEKSVWGKGGGNPFKSLAQGTNNCPVCPAFGGLGEGFPNIRKAGVGPFYT